MEKLTTHEYYIMVDEFDKILRDFFANQEVVLPKNYRLKLHEGNTNTRMTISFHEPDAEV